MMSFVAGEQQSLFNRLIGRQPHQTVKFCVFSLNTIWVDMLTSNIIS
jgi:hypothetical protein